MSRLVELTGAPDAERSVIGACLLQPDCLGWLQVTEREFTDGKWRELWRAMRAVWEPGIALDEVTLEAELRRRGTVELCVVAMAEAANEVPTAANVEHYAAILRKCRISRDVLSIAGDAPAWLEAGHEGADLLEEVMASLSRVERPTQATGVAAPDAARQELEDIKRDLIRGGAGVSWGVKSLDRATGGVKPGTERGDYPGDPLPGMSAAEVHVIAARPGVGKSLLGLNVARSITEGDEEALVPIFSWEDPTRAFVQRLLSDRTGIEYSRIRNRAFYTGDLDRLRAQYEKLPKGLTLHPSHGKGMREVARELRAMCTRGKVKAAVFDYVQRIPSPPGSERRDLGIGENLRMAEDLAAEFEFVPIFLSQLKRADSEKDPPTLSQLKDSGVIEQIAKLVLALWEGDPEAKAGTMTALILKQNGGEKHIRCSMEWRPEFGRVR